MQPKIISNAEVEKPWYSRMLSLRKFLWGSKSQSYKACLYLFNRFLLIGHSFYFPTLTMIGWDVQECITVGQSYMLLLFIIFGLFIILYFAVKCIASIPFSQSYLRLSLLLILLQWPFLKQHFEISVDLQLHAIVKKTKKDEERSHVPFAQFPTIVVSYKL